ncbi:acyl-CoA oxidase [Coniophora puteana RWD-64-598 SS2]|uniref:Acyl-CoA oxidase n=1 Tax=Coniophora puteana (strain RWD-64-598) TaxID=741705 RepID=A0A5M3MAU1_CONPW|nr:acyl-CoA oxidase [Coniophora puteana RWD-64-598 SS2]EIW75910.1 acyl-CoA oxidase [Coniophora puteana RWD-64-598 SS2]
MRTFNLTAADVQHCSSTYWAMMTDPIMALDTAMFTILAAHVGLTIGTLSRHLHKRPDFKPLINRLLRFDTVGIYLLSERGHGLDAFNVETTATKTAEGFVINTPREEACKFMPASTPSFGIPKVALVMARLIVSGEDRGPRFFVVPICNEREMYAGVESIRLGPRPGTSPLDFSITRFNNVRVPPSAIVSSDPADLSRPVAPLAAWWDEVWRIPLGTLAVTAPWISSLKAAAFVAGRYSAHRSLVGKGSEPIPIITFRTQQWPITHAVAVAHVLGAWYPRAAEMSADRSLDPRVRHALAVIVKTTACRQFQRCVPEIAERCGAQGTFEHNFMARTENDGKGVIIAEGDIMTLCIRLFSELVQQKYAIPLPDVESSILAAHAHGVVQENVDLLREFPGGHRDPAFDALVLPQAEASVEALGHALAYAAAAASGLPQPLLDVYEAGVVRRDPAWYSENLAITRMRQRIREDAAVASAVSHLPIYLDTLGIEEYVSAPIVSDAAWKAYYADMTVHTGSAPAPADVVQAVL